MLSEWVMREPDESIDVSWLENDDPAAAAEFINMLLPAAEQCLAKMFRLYGVNTGSDAREKLTANFVVFAATVVVYEATGTEYTEVGNLARTTRPATDARQTSILST